jgi:hypothetical protein
LEVIFLRFTRVIIGRFLRNVDRARHHHHCSAVYCHILKLSLPPCPSCTCVVCRADGVLPPCMLPKSAQRQRFSLFFFFWFLKMIFPFYSTLFFFFFYFLYFSLLHCKWS